MKQLTQTIDANTATAHVAYALSEIAAIYPITPASSMGELCDEWMAQGKKNIFDKPVKVVEMQHEGGAAGTLHGALNGGALATTFTASQGLLLMLPNMYKIAGELLPCVIHAAARSLATQALSIFGDHSDVMACRASGFAMLASANAQEAHDMALASHLATLESNIPFLHFFDGFRTSSELLKIQTADYESLKQVFDKHSLEYLKKFKDRAMRPDKPYAKVGAQNPDVYFQARESVNPYYEALPNIVKKYFKIVEEKLGRKYDLFEYIGDSKAEKIIVAMGSATDTIEQTVNHLNKQGEKVGAIRIRLYRPFDTEALLKAIPKTVKQIAILDRTKEPGAPGEPLYLDVCEAVKRGKRDIEVSGGRYGLSSKEFTPGMVEAIFQN